MRRSVAGSDGRAGSRNAMPAMPHIRCVPSVVDRRKKRPRTGFDVREGERHAGSRGGGPRPGRPGQHDHPGETRQFEPLGCPGRIVAAVVDRQRGQAAAVAEQEREGYPPVLLTSPGLRAMLSRLLRRSLPQLSVIAYAEVPADKMVQVTSELTMGEGE